MAREILLPPGHRLAGVQRACSVAMAMLAVQFCAGMIVNLYTRVPAGDAHAGYLREIETAPAFLTVHALIGLALLATGTVVAIRAIATRRAAIITLAMAGLGAVAGAFAVGETFVRNGADATSLWMASLTSVALLCYIAVHAIATAAPGTLGEPGAPAKAASGQAAQPTGIG